MKIFFCLFYTNPNSTRNRQYIDKLYYFDIIPACLLVIFLLIMDNRDRVNI